MNTIVIYRSKSGNTKAIAELIAHKLGTVAMTLNIAEKKGRGSKEEQEKEKVLFAEALEASRNADLVIVGTPVSYEEAHSKITRFCKHVEAKNIGIFCTYIKKMGTTLSGLETILRDRSINVVGSINFGNLNSGQFAELDNSTRDEYVAKAEHFIEGCLMKLKLS